MIVLNAFAEFERVTGHEIGAERISQIMAELRKMRWTATDVVTALDRLKRDEDVAKRISFKGTLMLTDFMRVYNRIEELKKRYGREYNPETGVLQLTRPKAAALPDRLRLPERASSQEDREDA